MRRCSSRSARAASSSRSSPSAVSAPASPRRLPRVRSLALDPGQLDLDLGRPLSRVLGALAQRDLGGAQIAELCAELAGAGRARVDPGPQRRVEAGSRGGRLR